MANPKSLEAQQAYIDNNPFNGFEISDNSILGTLEGRSPCPQCGKSRKFYCYSCYVPIMKLKGKLPIVKLPIRIDIIKHKHEIDGKSTAAHAAILAPDDVSIFTYPDIPDYDPKSTILIFPSRNALSISQLISGQSPECDNSSLKGFHPGTLMKTAPRTGDEFCTNLKDDNGFISSINKVIFIDSTWNQSKGIYKDEKLKRIQCVVIQNRISQFWRHQRGSPRWYLATIEAIHQFFIEIHLSCWGLHPDYKGVYNCFTEKSTQEFGSLLRTDENSYNGQYDNLLYFFQHMYKLIHEYYDHDNLHAYKRRLV